MGTLCGATSASLWLATEKAVTCCQASEATSDLQCVVQIWGNTVIGSDDGFELSVLSTGRESTGTGKVPQEEHGTEGVGRGASRPSLEGICWLESKADKCNKEGKWEQGGRLRDEVQRRKGKVLIAIQVQF